MKRFIFLWLAAAGLLLGASGARAAVTCTVNPVGFFSVYDGLATSDNLNQGSYTVTCTREASDPATFNYIAFTNDGLYNNGQNNRAKLTTANNFLLYDFFTTSAYTTNWSKSQKCMTGTLNFGTSLSASETKTYFSRIPMSQTPPQGLYQDTVTVYLSYNRTSCTGNAPQSAQGVMSVDVSTIPSCQIATPPGDLLFSYTSFQAAAVAASSGYTVRCSTNLAYTMAVSPNLGTLLNLGYTLSLSASGGSGNGALQNYSVNGNMPGGQVGTCATGSCTSSNVHTITVTY